MGEVGKNVGVVGANGRYGIWLAKFLISMPDEMVKNVLCIDVHPDIDGKILTYSSEVKCNKIKYVKDKKEFLDSVDVVIFSVNISCVNAVLDSYIDTDNANQNQQLWMDITSIKEKPLQAMLRARADVVGLHPMSAPPKHSNTLNGTVLAYCPIRLEKNISWFFDFLKLTKADCIPCSPKKHDINMKYVQLLIHSVHLLLARVIYNNKKEIKTLNDVTGFKTPPYDLAMTVVSRLLADNDELYMDIQYYNDHSYEIVNEIEVALAEYKNKFLDGNIEDGKCKNRKVLKKEFFEEPRSFFTSEYIIKQNSKFDFIVSFLKDLDEDNSITIQAKVDRSGQLYEYIEVLKDNDVNMTSLHSVKNKDGDFQFKIGLEQAKDAVEVQKALLEIQKRFSNEIYVI